MRIARHKLQVFLFLAAILVPAAVLVGLAGRMIVQDRELAAKHLVDQRSLAVDKLRRELSARLEAVRLQEIENASHRRDSANPAVGVHHENGLLQKPHRIRLVLRLILP